MLGNRNCHQVTLSRIVSFLLVALLWLLFCSAVSAGGLDWGGGGGDDTGGTAGCTPDAPLVIIPGPLGSPVRIVPFDEQTYLIADYSRKTLSWVDPSGTLSPFIETLGKPLSVAINASFRKNGTLKEAYYFVGNDDARTIDVYYEKNDQFDLVGQYPVGDNGIQALDMVFDQTQNHLFVVDGLAREALNFPMIRQMQAPADAPGSWIEDMVFLAKKCRVDCCIFFANPACKRAGGAYRLLSDRIKEEVGVPVLKIEVDAWDKRITPIEDVKEKIENFLEAVI